MGRCNAALPEYATQDGVHSPRPLFEFHHHAFPSPFPFARPDRRRSARPRRGLCPNRPLARPRPQRRRHRLDAHRHRPGAVYDPARAGAVLRRPGAGQKLPLGAHALRRGGRPSLGPVGRRPLQSELHPGQRLDRRPQRPRPARGRRPGRTHLSGNRFCDVPNDFCDHHPGADHRRLR